MLVCRLKRSYTRHYIQKANNQATCFQRFYNSLLPLYTKEDNKRSKKKKTLRLGACVVNDRYVVSGAYLLLFKFVYNALLNASLA